MSSVKRMTKIMDMATRAASTAEGELASAVRATGEAEAGVVKAEAALLMALDWKEPLQSIGDLQDVDMRIRARRMDVIRAREVLAKMRAEEAKKRAIVVEAKTNARRFEIWIERTVSATKEATNRKARLAEDELAARSWSPS